MSEEHDFEPRSESAPGALIDPIEPPRQHVNNYVVSPRKVATVSVLVAIAALGALSVVAATTSADGLATIALVLAILAFVIQIVVFAVQSQTAAEQRVRSEQLNTQTRSLLTEVRTTAQATQVLVGQQFNQVLQAFLSGVSRTAQETKFDPELLEQRLLENIRDAAQPSGGIAQQPTNGGTSNDAEQSEDRERARRVPPPRRPTVSAEQRRRNAERALRVRRFRSFPEEEDARDALAVLRGLTPQQRYRLQRLGEDEIESAQAGTYVGLSPEDGDSELENLALTRKARVDDGSGTSIVTRLSEKGEDAARILTATGDIPHWAADVIQTERSRTVADDDLPF